MVKKKKTKSSIHSLLKPYKKKRNFQRSPEPLPISSPKPREKDLHHFVIHKHGATRLHFDLRLECEGVLRSWAIPKGPSLDPFEKRLSVRVEDHPLSYRDFEGLIPKGNYGAGPMIIWDEGTYSLYETQANESHDQAFLRQYRKGNLKLQFNGQKLRGRFALIRIKSTSGSDWLLIKKRDEFASSADILEKDHSTRSGLSLADIVKLDANKKHVTAAAKKKTNKQILPKTVQSILHNQPKQPIPAKWQPMRTKRVIKADFSDQKQLWHSVPPGLVAIATITKTAIEIRTTKGLNLTSRCSNICLALADFPEDSVFIGVINLTKQPYCFYVCDILWLGKHTLASLALNERWQILSQLSFHPPIKLIPTIHPSELAKGSSTTYWCRSLAATYAFGTCNDDWLELTLIGSKTFPKSTQVTLTNPDKIFWPEDGFTKKDLYTYYQAVAEVMLIHLQNRPQSLHRHPNGIGAKGFFQKEVTGSVPGWIATTHVASYQGQKTVTYLLCQDIDTLRYLVNIGCIEINAWLSRLPDLTKPDYAVIDIDPGNLRFEEVIKAAKVIQKLFEEIESYSFCKTSGSRGLHIYLPTNGQAEFSACQKFAELVGQYLHKKLPAISSIERSPLQRRNKIYIDALQNRKGQTMACVYSVRPRPGAPVSTPIAWREVNHQLNPAKFTLQTVPKRLDKLGDLWANMFAKVNDIEKLSNRLKEILENLE